MFESTHAATEQHGGFTVAGVAHRGGDVDEAKLWASLDDYAADLDDVVARDERYGVLYDLDESGGEFTYVAGVEVDSTDGLSPELTVVEIPEATYAVFTPTVETIDDLVAELDSLGFSEDDPVEGPLFERYDVDENPTDRHASLEFYVPVDEDWDRDPARD